MLLCLRLVSVEYLFELHALEAMKCRHFLVTTHACYLYLFSAVCTFDVMFVRGFSADDYLFFARHIIGPRLGHNIASNLVAEQKTIILHE